MQQRQDWGQFQARGDLDAYRRQREQQGETVIEYLDKFTGKTMKRPRWDRLWADG
jgi:hypothetical protein